MRSLVVVGTVLQTPTPEGLEVSKDVAVVVGNDGVIQAVHPAASPQARDACAVAPRVVRLDARERLLPGLIDLHVHAPQWPQLGVGLDLPLERWLTDYTFPLEARFSDPGFARDVWDHLVPTLLGLGTTTAVYYSSRHEEATLLLARACVQHGQRAFVGRVAMDLPDGTPEWYRDADARAGVAASAASIDAIRGLPGAGGLVAPIITPRFVPVCSDDLLGGLGELAASTGAPVQTHCSESDWEHGYARERFGRRDAEVLRDFGLIRRGTILAHGTHLDDGDLALLRAAGAGVAHCPLSNAYFSNAVFPLRRAMRRGVAVGLGSDVAGGAEPALLAQCGHAVTASRMLEDGVDSTRPAGERGVPGSRVDVVAAFFAATACGASLLGIPAGVLAPGKVFDAFVVRTDGSDSGLRVYEGLDDETRVFEKIVRLAGPRDIPAVWVGGRRVVTR